MNNSMMNNNMNNSMMNNSMNSMMMNSTSMSNSKSAFENTTMLQSTNNSTFPGMMQQQQQQQTMSQMFNNNNNNNTSTFPSTSSGTTRQWTMWTAEYEQPFTFEQRYLDAPTSSTKQYLLQPHRHFLSCLHLPHLPLRSYTRINTKQTWNWKFTNQNWMFRAHRRRWFTPNRVSDLVIFYIKEYW